MVKIKHTRIELKRQNDALRRYQRYLPTLLLKKQQLLIEIRRTEARRLELETGRHAAERELDGWVGVFGEKVGIEGQLAVQELRTTVGNIAGVEIPQFAGVSFRQADYDLFRTPPWVDAALARLQEVARLSLEMRVLEEQVRRLSNELRVTTQRVNLFEKVKIPQTQENIRRIRIDLGEEQTAAVVRGKIAKGKQPKGRRR